MFRQRLTRLVVTLFFVTILVSNSISILVYPSVAFATATTTSANPVWGSHSLPKNQYGNKIDKVLSNGQFVYGPNMGNFKVENYLNTSSTHLLPYAEQLYGRSEYYSINPKVYLTLMEMSTQLLSRKDATTNEIENPFGLSEPGFLNQLDHISNLLFNAYYLHLYTFSPVPDTQRDLPPLRLSDGSLFFVPPEVNAGTYAVLAALAPLRTAEGIKSAVDNTAPNGFYRTYKTLFPEDNPLDETNYIYVPGDIGILAAPPDMLQLPYSQGEAWNFNGVHDSLGGDYGSPGNDMSSIDFSPGWPAWNSDTSNMWVVAAASGTPTKISNCNFKITHQDGWETTYYHLENIQNFGSSIQQNAHIGVIANTLPEAICNGGNSTGPHAHFTLKRNGALIALDGTALSGWYIHSGRWNYDNNQDYMWLERNGNKKYVSGAPLLNDGNISSGCDSYADSTIVLFDNTNCGGSKKTLFQSGLINLNDFNDQTSSIFIPTGWSVKVYEHENRGGASRCVNTTLANLSGETFDNGSSMNDKISSVEVFDNSNNCSEPPICPAVNLSDYSTTGIAQLDVCTPADTTPPTATWISPANNSTIRAQSVTLKANATDNSSGVDYVRFSAKYGGSWHNLYYDYSAPYEYTWDLCAADVPNGEIELGLQAYDKAGNEFVYSEHYANYKIYKDYTCGSPPAPTPAPSDLVKLYHQANYGGDPFWTGGAGNHGNINPLQFTYSMRVPNNWSVETFSDYNFGGQKQCWAGSVAKLGDYGWTSEVKSLKAYTSNVCPNPPPPGGQWQAKFWRTGTCYDDHSQCTSGNTTHQSQPSVPGVVGGRNYIIKEDWGQNSPGGSTPVDDWSGYFETTINFPAGNYVFYATHDDGLKLKIGSYGERSTSDERIDSDRLCNDQPYYLNGNTKVEAYLHERGGDATIQIWYDTNTAACVKPEAPALWWPDHQSTINDTTPAFDWLAISGGVEYRIQVADNANFTNAVINTTTTATNYTPGTALAYNTYYWRVQAKNGYNNWSNWSDIRQVTIAPVSVPTIAATDGLYTDKVQITWNSVSGATGYEVYRAASYSGSKTKLATVSTTTYNDTSAVADTVYYYWVKACNGSTCSNYSNYDSGWRSVSVSPPANVQASDGAFTDNVRVTWNGVSGATSYEVWRHTADNSAAAAKIAAAVTGTGYDDFAAALGQTYYYWVKAKNNAGTSGFSSSDSGHRLAPIPNQPGDPYEVSVTASSLTFGWTDNAANETGFKLYKWSGVAVDFVYHDQVGANVTTYTDTNLNCDSKYWYKVTAFNTYGESPQTGWLEAQTASCAPLDNTAPTFPVNDPGTGSPLIEPAGGVVINTPRPTFDWHDAVDDVGVAGYTLRITGSTQPIILAAGATDIDTVQSFYTPTFDLVDGTYTWTVQAYDAAGNRTSFVTAEAFTIATAFNDDQKVYLPLLTK